MSSTLSWRPAFPPKSGSLPSELKFALRKKYDEPIDIMFDESDIPFLEGLVCAGIPGANDLISAIRKHKQIIVKETY